MSIILSVIWNGIKYTAGIILFMLYIFICVLLTFYLLLCYIEILYLVDGPFFYLLLLFPFIIFVGMIVTLLKSITGKLFPKQPDYSDLNVDKIVKEIRQNLEKEGLIKK